jgi:hypothetical protein
MTAPLDPNDFEVEKAGVVLHVMISEWRPDLAHVIERGQNGGRDVGSFAPFDRTDAATIRDRLAADGWTIKETQQMIVTTRINGYNNVAVSGICSPDVTVDDVKKRFYHDYFGGRDAWVGEGRFGCTIHTD